MKKIYFVLAVAIMLTATLVCAEPAEIRCDNIYSATIAASGSANTNTLTLVRKSGFDGYFSVQPTFTGTGVLKIDYQVSNNGTTWSPAVQIVASATSGTVYPYPASGVNIFSGYQRLVLTETGTANQVVVTGLYRCSQ